jgi:serine beta-lactamase-like protein LACTB, mitochondrial
VSKLRTATRLALIVLGLALLLTSIGGLWSYVSATAAPLHPDPDRVPTATQPAAVQKWEGEVERARRLVRATLAERNLPGLSVAVGIGDHVVWAEGFGWANLKSRAPVTPATRFWIGTASTALTSAAAGVLLEKDRLRLDEEIQTHVPQFPRKPWPVTLRQLMGHVAGVETDGGDEGPLFYERCERPVAALPHFSDDQLLFEPGTQYRHSKYGWILVSAAVEAAADQPFRTFMREQVFQPLGMKDTSAESPKEENPEHIGEPEEDPPPLTFIRHVILEPLGIVKPEPPATSDRATFYVPRSGADPRNGVRLMRVHNLSCYAGAMAFLSTPSDLVRFGMAINGGRLLKPPTVQALQASQRLASGTETGYGLGWALGTFTLAGRQARTIGQDGEVRGGMATSLLTVPERGMVVAVASNTSYANTASIARDVALAFAASERQAPAAHVR